MAGKYLTAADVRALVREAGSAAGERRRAAREEDLAAIGRMHRGKMVGMLIEEHRASEHLFKSAEESTHTGEHESSYLHTRSELSNMLKQAKEMHGRADQQPYSAASRELRQKARSLEALAKSAAVNLHVKAKQLQDTDPKRAMELRSRIPRELLARLPARLPTKLKDPQAETLAKLREAKQKSIKTGPRGGQFYVGPGGSKVYVR